MVEVVKEATQVWSHKARIALFLSGMRHFRDRLRAEGITVHYQALTAHDAPADFRGAVSAISGQLSPGGWVVTQPGEWRVQHELEQAADQAGVTLDIRPDRHFLCSEDMFRRHAEGRKSLRMEYFYREMRKRTGVLMEDDKPLGGAWNFDQENRNAFGKQGPGRLPAPEGFVPDDITQAVLEVVEDRFGDHPGSLEHFDWPVTPEQAAAALEDFVEHRLPHFGEFQDAMWVDEPYLYHSRISSSLNLKLLDPRDVLCAVEQAHRGDPDRVPIAAAEGFIRQILGWREYVRGVYWMFMPEYAERNALEAAADLPDFYWTGDTDMHCLQQAVGQTLSYGYAHHIQRLMVTGLFALLYGVEPRQIHAWYLAVYVDAVEWVELPNVLGMSQFADGGVMASKPYAATGKYIQRMSNYCASCRYDPAQRVGDGACPFTTLYWDFLLRRREILAGHPRMRLQLRNLDRLSEADVAGITGHADALRGRFRSGRADA